MLKSAIVLIILVLSTTQVSGHGAFKSNASLYESLKLWKAWYDSGQTIRISDERW